MPDIQAFRGLRYDLGQVGNLSDVVAPPYDVIGPDLQSELYKRHPANVIRLILNRPEPGDDADGNRYSRAGRFIKEWRRQGVLFKEKDAAIYVYHQQFSIDGQPTTRRGFMCRLRLSRFGEGSIFPHEQTYPGPKADRLQLMGACQANLSPIFGLFPDRQQAAQQILEEACAGKIATEATDHLGVVHRLWTVTDVSMIAALSGVMGGKPMFVADGHHRFETACTYRDQLAELEGPLPAEHPANYTLMMCVGMDDPGMVVLPTHRLLRDIPAIASEKLAAKLDGCFTVEVAGKGSQLAEKVWADIEAEGAQGTLGLFCAPDQTWLIARRTAAGQARMAELAEDHSADWQGLGVAILHRLVLQTVLGIKELPRPDYVHQVEEVVHGLEQGDADGGGFAMAALVMPPSLDQIRRVSEHGERMPAKSTYFYPKLLSGLVINPLE